MECIEGKTDKCKNANKTLYIGTCYCECKTNSSTNELYLKIMNAYNSDVCTASSGHCLTYFNESNNNNNASSNITTTPYSSSCPIG